MAKYKEVIIGHCRLILADCMDVMREMQDKSFDLAICDPPYGIGFDGEVKQMANNKSKKWAKATGAGYERKEWDNFVPNDDYFFNINRVAQDQIIWGGNYFKLPQSTGWIFWDKGVADDFTLSPGELAWTSFNRSVNKISLLWAGFRKVETEKRIHPTQKPVALYSWLLTNYAKPGQTILDTHLGSGSSAIAANKLGFSFTGIELDDDYFNAACKRIQDAYNQVSLFDFAPETKQFEQVGIF
jgi:site-specific DNA-methyltransferase (adenine-specific)